MRQALPALLVAAILLGAALFAATARPDASPSNRLRRLHATVALTGTALAALALATFEGPVATITWEGLALAISAVATGAGFWARAGRPSPSRGILIVTHALLGAAGAAILATWAIR
jgi:hypothetical protein